MSFKFSALVGANGSDDDDFKQINDDQALNQSEEPKQCHGECSWKVKKSRKKNQANQGFEGGDEDEDEDEKQEKEEKQIMDEHEIWKKTKKLTDLEWTLYQSQFIKQEYSEKTEREELVYLKPGKKRNDGLEVLRILMKLAGEVKNEEEFLTGIQENVISMKCVCDSYLEVIMTPAEINFDFYPYRCDVCRVSSYEYGDWYLACNEDNSSHEQCGVKMHLGCLLERLREELQVKQGKVTFEKVSKLPQQPKENEFDYFEEEEAKEIFQNIEDLNDEFIHKGKISPTGEILQQSVGKSDIKEMNVAGFFNCKYCGSMEPSISGRLYGTSGNWFAHKECNRISSAAQAMKTTLKKCNELAQNGVKLCSIIKTKIDAEEPEEKQEEPEQDAYKENYEIACHLCTQEKSVCKPYEEEKTTRDPFNCLGCDNKMTYLQVLKCEKNAKHIFCFYCLGIDHFQKRLDGARNPNDRTLEFPQEEDKIKEAHLNQTTGYLMFQNKALTCNTKTLSEFYPSTLKQRNLTFQIGKTKEVGSDNDYSEDDEDEEEEAKEEDTEEVKQAIQNKQKNKRWHQLFEKEAANVTFLSDKVRRGVIRKNVYFETELNQILFNQTQIARNEGSLPGEFKDVTSDNGMHFFVDTKQIGLQFNKTLIISEAEFSKKEGSQTAFTSEIVLQFEDKPNGPSKRVHASAPASRTWLLPNSDICFDTRLAVFKQYYTVIFLVEGVIEMYEVEAKWSDTDDKKLSIKPSTNRNLFRKSTLILETDIKQVLTWVDQDKFTIKGIKIVFEILDKPEKKEQTKINEEDQENEEKDKIFDITLEIPNSQPKQFDFKNDITYSRYYEFLNNEKKEEGFLLTEVRLTDFTMQNEKLNETEKCILMHAVMKSLVNVVPHKKNISPSKLITQYSWVQPLEALGGHSLVQLMINNKQLSDHLRKNNLLKNFRPSILSSYTEANKRALTRLSIIQEANEVSLDLALQGPISFALGFSNTNIVKDPIETVMQYILSEPTCLTHQFMIQGLLPKFLAMDEPPASFSKYFQDDGNDTKLVFSTIFKQPGMPQSSDDACIVQIWEESCEYEFLMPNEKTAQIIKDNEEMNEDGEFPIKHYYFDFRPAQLQFKLNKFREGESKSAEKSKIPTDLIFEQEVFTMESMCGIISRINELYGDQIDQQKCLKDLIDGIFEKTQSFVLFQGAVFTMGMVVPFGIQLFMNENEKAWIILLNQVCLVFELLFFSVEMVQLRNESIKSYLSDFWNLIDLSLFFTFIAYYICRTIDLTSIIPINAEKAWIMPSLTPEKMLLWVFLNTTMILLLTIKCLFFVRVTQSYGQLVKLISQTLIDVKVFTVFFIVWCFIFAGLFRVAGFGFDYSDYTFLSSILANFLTIYRNAIGDIKTPTYTYWTNKSTISADNFDLVSGGMATYAWFLFFLNQTFMMIILLNFLIAIISQSYDMVISSASVSEYRDKVDFNKEIMGIRIQFAGLFSRVEKGTIFLLSSAIASNDSNANYEGFVKTIKINTHTEIMVLYEKLSQTLKGDVNDIQDQMDKQNTMIKSEFGKIRTEMLQALGKGEKKEEKKEEDEDEEAESEKQSEENEDEEAKSEEEDE